MRNFIFIAGSFCLLLTYLLTHSTEPAYSQSSFPQTPILDTFDRANGGLGANWSGSSSGYAVASNQLDVGSGGDIFWSATSFGVNQEAFVTLTTVDTSATEIDLLLKSQSGSYWGNGLLMIHYNAPGRLVQVLSYAPSQGWVQYGANIALTLVNGDQFGARATANGQIEVYRNGTVVASRSITGWTYSAGGGYVGLWMVDASATLLNNFGGGTVSVSTATPTPIFTATPIPQTATPVLATNTPLPPTATAIPVTNTPVPPTATPTASPTDLIFADGFETGNSSQWSATTTGANVSTSSALVGTYGLAFNITSNSSRYVRDDSPNNEPRYRARFYFDPNSIPMSNGDAHDLFQGNNSTTTNVLRVQFQRSNSQYQLRVGIRDDGNTWTYASWVPITDAPHYVEVDWSAAATAGSNNGSLTWWLDGVQRASLTGIDNNTRRLDEIRLGPVIGLDSGTRGTYYLDAFESRRITYIGAAATNPTATPLPPTAAATATSSPSTATHTPTATPIPPTATTTVIASTPTATLPLPSATATATATLVSPTATPNPNAFPSTSILDSFTRPNGAIGGNWAGDTSGFAIVSNRLDVGSGGSIFWNTPLFGTNQEAFFTLTTVDPAAQEINLLLKSQSQTQWQSGSIVVWYSPTGGWVSVWTYAPTSGWTQWGANIPVTLVNGDTLGARAAADGQVRVYHNGTLLATRSILGWPYANGTGYIGLWLVSAVNAVLDDFGGGNVGSGSIPPTATPIPPTVTPIPPTQTYTSTPTPNPPTATPIPPTPTYTPTLTPVPPTVTPVLPTATNTPTVTPLPPTATYTPTTTPLPPTVTPIPATATSLPPTVTPTATTLPSPVPVLEGFEGPETVWVVTRVISGTGSVMRETGIAAAGLAYARTSTTAGGTAQVQTNFSAPTGTWGEHPGSYRWQWAQVYLPSSTVAQLGSSEYLTIAGMWPTNGSTHGWFLRVRQGGQLYVYGYTKDGQPIEFNAYGTFPQDQWVNLELGLHSQNGPGVKRAFAFIVNGDMVGWFRQGHMNGETYDRVAFGILATNSPDSLTVLVDEWREMRNNPLPGGPDNRSTANLQMIDYRQQSGVQWQVDWSTWEWNPIMHPQYGLYSGNFRLQSGRNIDRMPSLNSGWGEIEIDWPNGTPPLSPDIYFGPMIGFRKDVAAEENLELIPISRGGGLVDLVFQAWVNGGPVPFAQWPLPLASIAGSSHIPESGDIIRARWEDLGNGLLNVRASYYDASTATWHVDVINSTVDLTNIGGINFNDGWHTASSITIDSPQYSIRRYTVGTMATYPQ